MKKLSRSRAGTIIFLIGVVLFSSLTLYELLSPRAFLNAPETGDMLSACYEQQRQSKVSPEQCLKQIVAFDFSATSVYRALSNYYRYEVGVPAWESGNWQTAIVAYVQYIYYSIFIYLTVYSTFTYLLLWVILGGYNLIYDRISDLSEKWIEGIVTGIAISLFIASVGYFSNFFNTWGRDQILPGYLLLLILVAIAAWFSQDISKLQVENIVIKLLLLALGITLYLSIPLEPFIRAIPVTAATTLVAVGYHFWRQLNDNRQQIAIVVYLILGTGLIASSVKHWLFLTTELFIGDVSARDLAEFVIDVMIFLLGFFLTFLEMNRGETFNEINNATVSSRNNSIEQGSTSEMPYAYKLAHITSQQKSTNPSRMALAISSVILLFAGFIYIRFRR